MIEILIYGVIAFGAGAAYEANAYGLSAGVVVLFVLVGIIMEDY